MLVEEAGRCVKERGGQGLALRVEKSEASRGRRGKQVAGPRGFKPVAWEGRLCSEVVLLTRSCGNVPGLSLKRPRL